MFCFLGILLKISLQPTDCGGYCSYFCDTNLTVPLSSDKTHFFEIPESRGFVSLLPADIRLSLNRFKQIRGSFHPEDKILGNGLEDKCY
jgi:hypothetical protein